MFKVEINIEAAKLDELIARVPKETPRLVTEAARAGYMISQRIVPRRTHRLAQSGSFAVTADSGGVVEAEIAYTAPHAIYVEMGTHRMGPRPFLAGSADSVSGQFFRACIELIK